MIRTLFSAALFLGGAAALVTVPDTPAHAQSANPDDDSNQEPKPDPVGDCECEAKGTETPAEKLPDCVKPGSVKCDISAKYNGVCTKGECPGPAKSCSFAVSMSAEAKPSPFPDIPLNCLWRLHTTKTNADGTVSTGLTMSVGKAFSHSSTEKLACKEKLVLKLTADGQAVCTITLECKDCVGK